MASPPLLQRLVEALTVLINASMPLRGDASVVRSSISFSLRLDSLYTGVVSLGLLHYSSPRRGTPKASPTMSTHARPANIRSTVGMLPSVVGLHELPRPEGVLVRWDERAPQFGAVDGQHLPSQPRVRTLQVGHRSEDARPVSGRADPAQGVKFFTTTIRWPRRGSSHVAEEVAELGAERVAVRLDDLLPANGQVCQSYCSFVAIQSSNCFEL